MCELATVAVETQQEKGLVPGLYDCLIRRPQGLLGDWLPLLPPHSNRQSEQELSTGVRP